MRSINRFAFFIAVILVGCRVSERAAIQDLHAVNYAMIDRYLYDNGKRETLDNGMNIAFFKNCTLFEMEVINMTAIKRPSVGDTLQTELVPKDTTYIYYLIEKNNSVGKRYDSLTATVGHSFPVDSLLGAIGLNKASLLMYDDDLTRPTLIKRNNRSGKIEEERYSVERKQENEPDSIYRYFDERLVNVPFTFAPRQDSLHNSKLWKTVFVLLPKAGKNVPEGKSPYLEATTQFTEITLPHAEEIIALFDRFIRRAK